MPEAYIFDAVRTPRGRGKKDGGLHQATPVHLSTTCFKAIRDRNDLDTSLVEDVVLGCTGPVGEQGANIGRITALNAGYDEVTAGAHIDRYCGSGLDAIHMMAACIIAGQIDMGIGGGVEPTMMLHGPWPASQKALKKAGMNISDIDLCEMNEAFASPTLHLIRESGLSSEQVNVNGGAIALGHPLGATGGMLVGTLVDELERRDKTVGLITMCMGAGMGIATIIERV